MLTPGHVDLRKTAATVLPSLLEGSRALDVGTFDGFWAFELERRGASVVAIDTETVDANEWPPLHRARLEDEARNLDLRLGRGFELAADVLGSNAQRVICDVYDLSQETTAGAVDLAFSGAILLHLRDPVKALERMLSVLAPGGTLIILEPVSVTSSVLAPRRPIANFRAVSDSFIWWYPNLCALTAWLRAAGFRDVSFRGFHRPPAARNMTQWYAALTARRHPLT